MDQHCTDCGNFHPGQPCATNPVTFSWKYGGTNVFVYGSWKNFQVGHRLELSREPPYYHETSLNLLAGSYQYKYQVDSIWRHDENEKVIPDGHGQLNNLVNAQLKILNTQQVEVFPKRQWEIESDEYENDDEQAVFSNSSILSDTVRVKIRTTLDSSSIRVKGSWDNWDRQIPLQRRFVIYAEVYENYVYLQLLPGTYEYKFIIQNQWVHDPSIPNIRNQMGSHNNIIHVKKKKTSDNLNYEPEKLIWNEYKLQNYRLERINGHSLTYIGNQLFIFGGLIKGNFSNKLFILDEKSLNLQLVEEVTGTIPELRGYHNAIPYGGKIIVYGGLNSQTVFNDYYVYNTSTQQWSTTTLTGDIPTVRERATLTLIQKEDTLVYFGGYSCTQYMEIETVFNDVHCLNLNRKRWKALNFAISPPPRYAHSATQIQYKMFVFGGLYSTGGVEKFYQGRNFNDLWVLDFQSKELNWRDLTLLTKGQPPEPRHGHTASIMGRKIFVFGGRGDNSKQLFNDIYILDPFELIWRKPISQGQVPCPRYYHAAEVMNDRDFIIIGGNPGQSYLKQEGVDLRKRKAYIIRLGKNETKEEEEQKQ